MEMKINIQKKHFYLLSFFILAVGFVIAQGSKPNPGHVIGEVSGAAVSCDYFMKYGQQTNKDACKGPQSSKWDLTQVAGYAAHAWNSERLGGKLQQEIIAGTLAADKYEPDIRENVQDMPGGTIENAANGCGRYDYGCCTVAVTEYCQAKYKNKGYKFAHLVSSCGRGWCNSGGSECKHTFYCIR